MEKDYSFKRSFYYDVEKAIETSHISFILGPRKCGKTVCMHQLEAAFDNAVYVDMKADFDSDEQRRKFVTQALKDIEADKDVIYLIDEAAYMALPDKDIAKIAAAYSKYVNYNTKFVFTGSTSKSLEFWGSIACGGFASFIRVDFLSYLEWLAYKGVTQVSEETYLDFLFNIRDFYSDFIDTKDYLQGCLDETFFSNRKAVEYFIDNANDDLNVERILDVLYASFVRLHNHTNYQSFSNVEAFVDMLAQHFGKKLSEVEVEEQARSISEMIDSHYKNFKAMMGLQCKAVMQFLADCGLITLTYVSDELSADPYITQKVLKDTNELYMKPQFFSRFYMSVNYPMFYMDLVKSVLKDKMVSELPKELLVIIVESHVRSLLPSTGCFKYHDENGVEIDYVSLGGQALEISVSNKEMGDVHLYALSEEYRKILLTKDVTDEVDGIKCIPYYQFIYDNSVGKELVEKRAGGYDGISG